MTVHGRPGVCLWMDGMAVGGASAGECSTKGTGADRKALAPNHVIELPSQGPADPVGVPRVSTPGVPWSTPGVPLKYPWSTPVCSPRKGRPGDPVGVHGFRRGRCCAGRRREPSTGTHRAHEAAMEALNQH